MAPGRRGDASCGPVKPGRGTAGKEGIMVVMSKRTVCVAALLGVAVVQPARAEAFLPQVSSPDAGAAYIQQLPQDLRPLPPRPARRASRAGRPAQAATIGKPDQARLAVVLPTVGKGVNAALPGPDEKVWPSVGAGTVNR
jgi:hypothetical protein